MPYVCGHSPHELSRLTLQGAFFEDITRRALERAGIGSGMRVLDIGCGSGDLSLLVAALVGEQGRVVGIDRAPEAIAAATARAAAQGVHQVAFEVAEIDAALDEPLFDMLVGRFVLMHQRDPATMLRAASRHVRPGGVVLLIESHVGGLVSPVHSWPMSSTYDRVMRWMIALLEASGAHSGMGLRLRQTFLEAHLPEPVLALEARVEGGPDADIYRYTADSVRSMLPAAERLDMPLMSAVELGDLESRLREETVRSGGVLTSPLIVSAWSRMPD
jgi:ubiquinone/menaquinone biosynthesis C-methylase UbiE